MADDASNHDGRIDRRKFLGGLGAGAAAGLAGCGGDGGDGSTEDSPGGSTDTETATPDEGDIERGGTPTIGMVTAPTTLNLLAAGSTYEANILDQIYTYGTTVHPQTQDFIPWAIEDWTLNPDNVGSSDPTITGTMMDGLTFSDGEDATVQDMKFTIEYMLEQAPLEGTLSADTYRNMEEVRVDASTNEIMFFMNAPDQSWFTGILGSPILPQHIWKDVDDHTQYQPRNEDEVIGSGWATLEEYNWENWFELSARDPEDVPMTTHEEVDWIRDEAPYIDGVRFEIYGSQNAVEQDLLEGNITTLYLNDGVSINTAIEAQDDDSLTVHQAENLGYSHISFNTRRVPFDDKAFRQFLRRMFDGSWVVEEPNRGIGANKGDYPVIHSFDKWRPGKPTEIDEVDGIQVPDLTFPGEAGTFQVGDSVQDARDWLANHSDAKHDYTWEEANAPRGTVQGNTVLHVNGQPLHEAHTDNEGNGGQGPLELSYNPPQEDLVESRFCQRFVGALQSVGVPTESLVQSFNSQEAPVYSRMEFDMYAMGWAVSPAMTHFLFLYSSQGVIGPEAPFNPNPMGYTGADDLIMEDAELMDFEERPPVVHKILAQIWQDAPTIITQISNLLEPTRNDFKGWTQGPGSIIYNGDLMNLYQNPNN